MLNLSVRGDIMYRYIEDRVLKIAEYIADNKATVRAAGEYFGVSKSTVHSDMTLRLKDLDEELYERVRVVLEYNLSVRHLRGGESTKQLYIKKD